MASLRVRPEPGQARCGAVLSGSNGGRQEPCRPRAEAPRPSARGRHDHLDVGAAIAAAAEREGEPDPGRPALLHFAAAAWRPRLRLHQAEPGRSPGTLPDAGDALGLEPSQSLRSPRRSEARALHRLEIVADRRAAVRRWRRRSDRDPAPRVPAAPPSGRDGKDAPRDPPASAPISKCFALGTAMQAVPRLVEDQQHAPGVPGTAAG